MSGKFAIICVDDEKIVLDSLQEQLETSFGDRFTYEIAESVDEAWEVLDDLSEDEYEIALVISDWLMPKTKGDKFLIDCHQRFPNACKIMLTGQADPAAVQNAMHNANLNAYIKKPWQMEDLADRINRAFKDSGISIGDS